MNKFEPFDNEYCQSLIPKTVLKMFVLKGLQVRAKRLVAESPLSQLVRGLYEFFPFPLLLVLKGWWLVYMFVLKGW